MGMADAGPVFIVGGVVLAVIFAWAVWVNVRRGPAWKADPAESPPPRQPDSDTL